MQQYDVIVIGAGPSGAIASKTCAGNGLNTLLLEKEGIARFKQLMLVLRFMRRKKQHL